MKEILSVSEVLRKDSGKVKVIGMIISRTQLYKLISAYTERCNDLDCNYYQEVKIGKTDIRNKGPQKMFKL